MEKKRKIIPPVYLLLTLMTMTIIHYLFPVYRFMDPPISYIGIPLIVSGLFISSFSARSFRKAGTPVIPFEKSTSLVTSGFFRYTRNPMYLGMILDLIGASILFGTVGTLFPIPVFVFIIRYNFIRGEEKFMEEIFGAQYLLYKARVRRWI